MNKTLLYQKLCAVPHCTTILKQAFLELFTPVQFTKGQVLITPNQSLQSIYFIESGIMRGYQQKEDRCITYRLAESGNFILPDGYFNKFPSNTYIDFIIDTECFLVDHRTAKRFFKSNPQAIFFLLCMLDEKVLIAFRREKMLRITDLDQRYRYLYRSNPFILNNTPREIIASYLNISVRHYDRIRKSHISER